MLRRGRSSTWQRIIVSTCCSLSPRSPSMSSASTEMLVEELVAHNTHQNGGPADQCQPCQRAESMPDIHVTAVVHPNAQLGSNVLVGPYSVIGPDVVLEANVRLQNHVVIDGKTRIGDGTQVHSFASLGGEPQDKKHWMVVGDQATKEWTLRIGNDCVIREHVTVHGSTSYSRLPTSVGDECWLLCGAHVAHDSQLGRRVVVSNNACLAGHVSIGDGAIIGGQAGLKQHVSVGPLAMVGGQSAVAGDVLPYGMAVGNRAKLTGLNLIGLRRAGVSRSTIKLLLQVYRYIFGGSDSQKTGFAPALDLTFRDTVVERAIEAKQFLVGEGLDAERIPMVHEMMDFVLASSQRFRSSLCHAAIATPSR